MIRLDEGIYTWSRFDRERRCNFNGFLLRADGGCVVVDPVPMEPDDKAYFEALGVSPEAVVVTNRNHLRDSASWPAPLALCEAEAGEVDVKPRRLLRPGDTVGPGLEVIGLPGKSPGEIGLFWKSRRVLLLGDALIGPGGRLKTVPDPKIDDKARLIRSLKTLPALDFDILLLADGDPVMAGAKKAVEEFVASL